MTRPVLALALILVAAAIAGCATGGDGEPPAPGTSPTGGSPASGGRVTVLSVTSTPSRAAPGQSASVCWQVEGSGTIPHTAVHYDTVSRPDARSFLDYTGGIAYPGNETAQAAQGYALPGTFCTSVPVPEDGPLYFRAHAIDAAGPPGNMTGEHMIRPAGSASGVTVLAAPARAAPGADALVCWRVQGEGNVAHTAVHFDTQSRPDARAFQEYKAGAAYPDNETAQATEGYNLPGTFCANVRMPASGGNVYFRAHVIDAAGAPGKLSPEYVIREAGNATAIAVTRAPANATAGSAARVCWRVEGSGNVAHTAVYFDTQSHGNATSFRDYPGGVAYPENATADNARGYELPGDFCTSVTMPLTGSLFLRAHVVDRAGPPGKLSQEARINVG